MVLFADDTSQLITDSNKLDFNTNINQSLGLIAIYLYWTSIKATVWSLEWKIMRLKLQSYTIT
jgi:hypothetical protein